MTRGHEFDYKKQIREELLDDAVVEVIIKLVSNPKFAVMMQEKISSKVDTAAIDGELAEYEKQLRQYYAVKLKLAEEIDSLDPDDRHYMKRKADLDDRLYRMYDKIEDVETQLIETRAKKRAVEAEKLTGDNIYKVLIYFEKLYAVMNERYDYVHNRLYYFNLSDILKNFIDRKIPMVLPFMDRGADNGAIKESIGWRGRKTF